MVGMRGTESDPSVHLASVYCALTMYHMHARQTDTALVSSWGFQSGGRWETPAAVRLQELLTDGIWASSNLGSTKERGL